MITSSRTIVVTMILAVIAGCGVWYSLAASAAVIRVETPTLELGELIHGETVTKTVVLRNAGNARLRILNVRPDCFCSVANLGSNVIEPGGTAALSVTLRTEELAPGPFVKRLQVTSTDPARPSAVIELRGTLTQEFVPSVSSVVFTSGSTSQLISITKIKGTSEVGRVWSTDSAVLVSITHVPDGRLLVSLAEKPAAPDLHFGVLIIETTNPRVPEIRLPIRKATF